MNIYFCGREECQPKHSFGPAIRSHYLLHFILKGQGIYKTSKDTFKVKAGEAFLIQPGEVTYYEADADHPWVYAWIAFDGPNSASLLTERNFIDDHMVGKIEKCKIEKIMQLLAEMVLLFENATYDERELLGYFHLIMSCMEKTERGRTSGYDKEYLKKAIDYMHNNYSYNININDVARHIGIDRTYLYRIFMQYKKISPKHYLMEYRLLVAKDMLENTEYNITQIALSAGFHDSSSFSKAFQRTEQMSPVQFRKMKVSLPKI